MSTDWKNRISCDQQIHHGEPCIHGTRVSVATVVASLADMTMDELLKQFPQLKREDVQATLRSAAEALRGNTTGEVLMQRKSNEGGMRPLLSTALQEGEVVFVDERHDCSAPTEHRTSSWSVVFIRFSDGSAVELSSTIEGRGCQRSRIYCTRISAQQLRKQQERYDVDHHAWSRTWNHPSRYLQQLAREQSVRQEQ